MLSQFQASYQRVEASLQKLTDSIAAYHPSVSATDELLAADEHVNDNLKLLIKHQQNHLRIHKLRQTAESLDGTIKNTIKLLADARKEIQAIPSSDSAGHRREVNVDELLSYAKFISKTTVPPTLRKPLPDDLAPKSAKPEGTTTNSAAAATDAPMTNGIATPLTAEPDGDSNAAFVKSENVGIKAMDAKERALLDPAAALPFEPWPSLGVIQSGALAEIQKMVESGKDPASVLTPEEQAEMDRKRQEEEERERVEQEETLRRRMSAFDSGRRRTVAEDEVFNPDDL